MRDGLQYGTSLSVAFRNLGNATDWTMRLSAEDGVPQELAIEAMHYAQAIGRAQLTVGMVRELVQTVATHYADDGHTGAIGCIWCGEWLSNGRESLEDTHKPTCLVRKAQSIMLGMQERQE